MEYGGNRSIVNFPYLGGDRKVKLALTMKEKLEIRVGARESLLLFERYEGQLLGHSSVKKIQIDPSDPRYPEIGNLQKKLRAKGSYFFSGWEFKRKYTKAETDNAKLFQFICLRRFEPTGEECGTIYDESTACPVCKSDAKQITPLHLRRGSIPKTADFATTIARNEFIVSKRAVDLFKDHNVVGAEYAPVWLGNKSKVPSPDWFQLIVRSSTAEISSVTELGIEPFDKDEKGEYRCIHGHKAGLNIISELKLSNDRLPKVDFWQTRQFIGLRMGLLRPFRIILVSQKIRKIIEANKLKGCLLEIAYLSE